MTTTNTGNFKGPKIAHIRAFFLTGGFDGGKRIAAYSASEIAYELSANPRQTPKRLKELEAKGFLDVARTVDGELDYTFVNGRKVLQFRLAASA